MPALQIVCGKFCGGKHLEVATFTDVGCQYLRLSRCGLIQQVINHQSTELCGL